MSIRLRFACGHDAVVSETVEAPSCGCGETQIARTFAPAPRFRGACSGPYCETRTVDPAVVDLTTAGPLIIKQES